MVKRSASRPPWTVELADAELQFMTIGGGCKMRCVALFIGGQEFMSDPAQMMLQPDDKCGRLEASLQSVYKTMSWLL